MQNHKNNVFAVVQVLGCIFPIDPIGQGASVITSCNARLKARLLAECAMVHVLPVPVEAETELDGAAAADIGTPFMQKLANQAVSVDAETELDGAAATDAMQKLRNQAANLSTVTPLDCIAVPAVWRSVRG